MFSEDVRQSARLALRCLQPFSSQENAIIWALSAEEPCDSVNINEGVRKVLAAVSHADRHRKWYCHTSLLADTLVRASFWDAHIWITNCVKAAFHFLQHALRLLSFKFAVKVYSSLLSYGMWAAAPIVNVSEQMQWTIELFKLVYKLGVEHFSEWLMPALGCDSFGFWLVHMWVAHNQWLSASGCLDKDCGCRYSMLLTL